ncbi:ion transporter [Thiosulfatimonas sediminis]|nr:ion transporter [Thiosulfatimonas sediminis]
MQSLQMKAEQLVEASWFGKFIIYVILFNALILGLQTSKSIDSETIALLDWFDRICLSIFVIEIGLKLVAYRGQFFKNGWNNFDFLIVAVSLIPASGDLAVLRALRILRLLRLVNAVPSMRRVVSGMLHSIPGVFSVGGLLAILFYIGAVMSTSLFGDKFPEWFGDIAKSMYTLFQIMTFESWSMGIVRPVMEVYPYSWLFFIPFIVLTSFTVLNLFIGIIIDAMNEAKEEETHAQAHEQSNYENINQMRTQMEQLQAKLDKILENQNRS